MVLAAFAAFVFVWPDDLWEEAAYTQSGDVEGVVGETPHSPGPTGRLLFTDGRLK